MPSIWSKISEWTTWFLWGKRPYSELSSTQKQEARRDLYCRLFFIANAPLVLTYYGTFLASSTPATFIAEGLSGILPARYRKAIGYFAFGVYFSLQIVTFGTAFTYIVFPFYSFVFHKFYQLGEYAYSSFISCI